MESRDSITNPVYQKYLQTRFVFVPRGKILLEYLSEGEEPPCFKLTIVEDIVNNVETGISSPARNSHMQHAQGNWTVDKTYWVNFL